MACALRIQDYMADRRQSTHITLLEGASQLGGKLRSDRVNGFVIDRSADIFLASRPEAIDLCTRLGLHTRLIDTNPDTRRTFVRLDDGLHPMVFYRNQRLVTLKGGMQELTDAAAAALRGVEVHTHTAVRAIVALAEGYEVRTVRGVFRANAVVVAVPARPAAPMLRELSPEASRALASISYRSSITVTAGYPAGEVSHFLHGYGYLVPGAQRGEVSACTWTSSKISGRAPAGHVLLRGFVHGGPGVTLAHARAVVLAELDRTLGINAVPILVRAYMWRDGLPVAGVRRLQLSKLVAEALRAHPGCVIAGGSVDGVGIPDSIRSGRAAADAVLRFLHADNTRTSSGARISV